MRKIIGFTMALVLATTNLAFAENIDLSSTSEVTTLPALVDADTLEELKPAREMGELLGYVVTWVPENKSLNFTFGNESYTAQVGSPKYTYNGNVILETSKTIIIDDKAYIPDSFVKLIEEKSVNNFADDFYVNEANEFFNALLTSDYQFVEEKLNGNLEITQMQEIWGSLLDVSGEYKEIDIDKYEVTNGYDEEIGSYVSVAQYAEFSDTGIIVQYLFAKNGTMIGLFFDFYEIEVEEAELETGIEEISYKVGVNKTQNAKLMKNTVEKSDTVVLLVSGSGPNDLDENIYGNKPLRDIAIGLAKNGIDSFRFDKVSKAIADNKYVLENKETFTVKEEYLVDVKEVTNLLKDMGYENIYFLGHSQGAMLAPRLYEDNEEIYDGLILLAGTPRTLSDVAYDQATNQIESLDEDSKKEYEGFLEAELEKIENLNTYTDEELAEINIIGLPAYYIKEMNSFDAGEIAKGIDKPILVLQGEKDFQVFADIDYVLWKEVLKDNKNVEFVLYEDLGHLFTKTPENPTNSFMDYIPAQNVDERVINDIVNFINK